MCVWKGFSRAVDSRRGRRRGRPAVGREPCCPGGCGQQAGKFVSKQDAAAPGLGRLAALENSHSGYRSFSRHSAGLEVCWSPPAVDSYVLSSTLCGLRFRASLSFLLVTGEGADTGSPERAGDVCGAAVLGTPPRLCTWQTATSAPPESGPQPGAVWGGG